MRFISGTLLLLFLLFWQNATAQDTVRHRNTIYVRLPTDPLTRLLSLDIDKSYSATGLIRFFMPMKISYGYTTKKWGEWLGHMSYYHQIAIAPYGVYGEEEKNNRSLLLCLEKRWFLFPRKTIRPFIGLFGAYSFTHLNQSLHGNEGDVYGTEAFNIKSAGLGTSIGIRIKYHRWNYVLNIQAHRVLWERIKSSSDSYKSKEHYAFYESNFQLGYSF